MHIAVKKTCQLGGFLALISMLFLALSVGSYSSDDPTWNYYVSHDDSAVRNLGGVVGAALADGGFQALGSTIFLFIGISGWCAWRVMQGRVTGAITIAWRGGVLLAAASAGVALLRAHGPFFGAEILTGGIIGQWLADMLVWYVNLSGAYLFVGSAIILALVVGVDNRAFYGRVWRGLRTVSRRCYACMRWVKKWLQGLVALVRQGGAVVRYGAHMSRKVLQQCKLWPAFAPRPVVEAKSQPLLLGLEMSASSVSSEDENAEENMPLPDVACMQAAWSRDQDEEQSSASTVVASPPRHTRKHRTAYRLPTLNLLDKIGAVQKGQNPEDLESQARFLERKLRDFGVEGEVVQVLPGPVITMYEFAPAPGIKVNKITNLQDDLALVMRALSVRVVAPIPGKAVVGIEIPNKRRETVRLRELLDSDEFRGATSKLSLTLGKDILGKPVITDLALIPHLLIAGATGSGKSVGLNSMICSLLFGAMPDEVKMIMIDPKMLELSIYDGIPHLLIPVVTNPKQAAVALRRVVQEMERRYELLAAQGVRSIAQYNQSIAEEQTAAPPDHAGDETHPETFLHASAKLPYLVVIIDELSDLMMVSSREVEDALTRIAQMARAAGIHLIVATQRPSVDVLTGVIKANFPARLSFQVTSKTDSRTILDANGAEKLLGQGDMLFLAPGTSKPQRIHGAYVSEAEINRLVAALKEREQPHYDDSFLVPSSEEIAIEDEEYDEKYDEAIALVARSGQASISMLQRRLRVGYNRAARIIEIMEREGVIGPADGVKPREVLVRENFDEV